MQNGATSKRKLTPKQVEEILEVSEGTLRYWRKIRKGPPYHREVGRIFYYIEDFEIWRQATKWN